MEMAPGTTGVREGLPSPRVLPGFLNSPRHFLIVLAAFFSVHVLLRLITSSAADLDESEQLVFSQAFQWGYGPQPPLYTWLQILFFKLFGPSILGLSLLKNVLLFAVYAFTYGTARVVTRNHLGGVLATIGLLFIPQIAWESHRDLTHSILASASSAATLCVFLRLQEGRCPRWYALLGVALGIGMLSNHSFWLVLLGLITASLCVKEFRAVPVDPWMLLSLGIASVIVAPYAVWVMEHWPVVLSTSHKLRIRDGTPFGLTALRGFGNLAVSWVSHVISAVLIYSVLDWRHVVPFPREILRQPCVRLLLLLVVFALAGVALTMLLTHATSFKGRWLQPLFFCVPILYAALLHTRIDERAWKRIFTAAVTIAAIVMVLLPGRVWTAEKLHREEQLTVPFGALFNQMQIEINRADVLVADTHVLGGNLRLRFPNKAVLTPKFQLPAAPSANHVVVLFNAAHQQNPPLEVQHILTSLGKQLPPEQIRFVEVPRPGQRKPLRFGTAILN